MIFLTLSLISLSIHLIRFFVRLNSRSKHSKKYLPIPPVAQNSTSPASAISIAENQVILKTVKRESPDFASPATQKELLGDAAVFDVEGQDITTKEITFKLAMRAVWGSKKDLVNVLGAAGMVALTILKLVEGFKAHEDGSGWTIFETSAWVSSNVINFLLVVNSLIRYRSP